MIRLLMLILYKDRMVISMQCHPMEEDGNEQGAKTTCQQHEYHHQKRGTTPTTWLRLLWMCRHLFLPIQYLVHPRASNSSTSRMIRRGRVGWMIFAVVDGND